MQRSPAPSQGDQRERQGGEDVHDDEAPEFVGSDVVTRNTRVISQNLVEILTDTNAQQWDDGWVLLADSYQFRLWSHTNPEPIERDGESIDAFTARQRAARRDRITLLAGTRELSEIGHNYIY